MSDEGTSHVIVKRPLLPALGTYLLPHAGFSHPHPRFEWCNCDSSYVPTRIRTSVSTSRASGITSKGSDFSFAASPSRKSTRMKVHTGGRWRPGPLDDRDVSAFCNSHALPQAPHRDGKFGEAQDRPAQFVISSGRGCRPKRDDPRPPPSAHGGEPRPLHRLPRQQCGLTSRRSRSAWTARLDLRTDSRTRVQAHRLARGRVVSAVRALLRLSRPHGALSGRRLGLSTPNARAGRRRKLRRMSRRSWIADQSPPDQFHGPRSVRRHRGHALSLGKTRVSVARARERTVLPHLSRPESRSRGLRAGAEALQNF